MTVHRLTRWEPMRDMLGITERMGRLFDTYSRRSEMDEEGAYTAAWVPAVDVRENADSLVLTFEIPGVDPKEVEVSVEHNRLTVRGERVFNKTDEGENYHRVERTFGSFERSFRLPTQFDADNIEARSRHGVLTLTLPKREEAKPRSIKIAIEEK